MRAVRKDYFLDHDHSAYVDQWDWERAITAEDRTLEYLTATVRVDLGGDQGRRGVPPRALAGARRPRYPAASGRADLRARGGHPRGVPRPAAQAAGDGVPSGSSGGLHLRDRLAACRRLPARAARSRLRRLVDRDALGGRAADARPERRHPRLEPGHPPPARADVGRDPRDQGGASSASCGCPGSSTSSSFRTTRRSCETRSRSRSAAGIGQSRTMMLLLRKAHLGEVSVTVWPQVLKDMCGRGTSASSSSAQEYGSGCSADATPVLFGLDRCPASARSVVLRARRVPPVRGSTSRPRPFTAPQAPERSRTAASRPRSPA